ncbi:hypothetical protein ACYZUC_22340 [Pseudomonas sp. GT1P32]
MSAGEGVVTMWDSRSGVGGIKGKYESYAFLIKDTDPSQQLKIGSKVTFSVPGGELLAGMKVAGDIRIVM